MLLFIVYVYYVVLSYSKADFLGIDHHTSSMTATDTFLKLSYILTVQIYEEIRKMSLHILRIILHILQKLLREYLSDQYDAKRWPQSRAFIRCISSGVSSKSKMS